MCKAAEDIKVIDFGLAVIICFVRNFVNNYPLVLYLGDTLQLIILLLKRHLVLEEVELSIKKAT